MKRYLLLILPVLFLFLISQGWAIPPSPGLSLLQQTGTPGTMSGAFLSAVGGYNYLVSVRKPQTLEISRK